MQGRRETHVHFTLLLPALMMWHTATGPCRCRCCCCRRECVLVMLGRCSWLFSLIGGRMRRWEARPSGWSRSRLRLSLVRGGGEERCLGICLGIHRAGQEKERRTQKYIFIEWNIPCFLLGLWRGRWMSTLMLTACARHTEGNEDGR